MTESEWLAGKDLRKMLTFLRGKASDRKIRLFACACCRHLWDRFTAEQRQAVELSERLADGLTSKKEVGEARKAIRAVSWNAEAARAHQTSWDVFGYLAWHTLREKIASAAEKVARSVVWQAATKQVKMGNSTMSMVGDLAGAQVKVANLLREIQGNPFQKIGVGSNLLAWKDSTVPRIAQAIYDNRSFADLPILADALEEAGCDDADILAHCRGGGEHVRGCWVVDLMLGKV